MFMCMPMLSRDVRMGVFPLGIMCDWPVLYSGSHPMNRLLINGTVVVIALQCIQRYGKG
jgi:hypothetical protein